MSFVRVVVYRAPDGFVSSLRGRGCIVPSRLGLLSLRALHLHLYPPVDSASAKTTSPPNSNTLSIACLFLQPNLIFASSTDGKA